MTEPETLLRALFARAVAEADPMQVVPAALPPRPEGRVVVVGAGKASARMAEAVEHIWGPCEGLVITRYGHARPCTGIRIVEAAHPVPDEAGARATDAMLSLLAGCGAGDTVLALISGGASALLTAPVAGVTLSDKRAVTSALLASGAPIGQINVVRTMLSRVKGGGLAAAAWPARTIGLLISDVPGDDPAAIGSGPTVAGSATARAARSVLARYGIAVPASVDAALTRGVAVSPDDPRLSKSDTRIVAAPSRSIAAAAKLARAEGCEVRILGTDIEGEAREVALDHAAIAQEIAAGMRGGDRPVLLLSGGELTVTRQGDGIGGPNAEYALALALALGGAPGIHAIACDTDGIDGAAEIAGAVIDPGTIRRTKGAEDALARNDAHGYFAQAGGQVVTGPTLTNVNDFRAILVLPRD